MIRSHKIWQDLEAKTNHSLLHEVGGLIYGNTTGNGPTHGVEDFLGTTIAAAQKHGIEHELLEAQAMRERFPLFKFSDTDRGYYEPTAGYVCPETCIDTQLTCAQKLGAHLALDTVIDRIEQFDDHVRLTSADQTWTADQVILSAGGWLKSFLPENVQSTFTIYPQVQAWYRPQEPAPKNFPIFIRIPNPGDGMLYGFPPLPGDDGAMKVASEQFTQSIPVTQNDVKPTREEVDYLFETACLAIDFEPGPTHSIRCAYTVTPDQEFVIDRLPERDRILLASPCSGHGFKHSAGLGELIATWCITEERPKLLAPFSLSRFK